MPVIFLSLNQYWLLWVFACTVGELLGIGTAAGVALLYISLVGEPHGLNGHLVMLAVMILAGCFEGAVTGYFQWAALRIKFKNLHKSEWMLVTISGAAFAWFLGMLPSVYFSLMSEHQQVVIEVNNTWFAIFSVVSGVILGGIFGAFQYLSLRRYVHRAGGWIVANSMGWMIGMMIIYVAASIPDKDTPVFLTLLMGSFSGILAGLAVGIITGWLLIRLEKREGE